MEKYLITGFAGFVSQHFIAYLESQGAPVSVVGLDINEPGFSITSYTNVFCSFRRTDLLDKNQVDNIIYQFQPNYILHLASYSSVAFSWKNPVASFANNTNIFLNLLEQIRALNLKCKILSVGSSEEYGNVKSDELPLTEMSELRPVSPYAVARVSQEMLSRVYVDGFGLNIVLTRSFNHIGPKQRDIFVVPSFARQLVEIKYDKKPAELVTGDLSIVRDFLDVRDVVRAYYLLLHKGQKGEVYNICSGKGVTLRQVVDLMTKELELDVALKTNPDLIRPSDNAIIIGSNDKLQQACGWQPEYALETSIRDVVAYWRTTLYPES